MRHKTRTIDLKERQLVKGSVVEFVAKPGVGSSERKRIFANNLLYAVKRSGWTQKEAADAWDVPYQWVRRATTKGIAFTHAANDSCEKIAEFYEVPVAQLWDANFGFRYFVGAKVGGGPALMIAQLQAVLEQYRGRSKPEPLRRAIDTINIYYSNAKFNRDTPDGLFEKIDSGREYDSPSREDVVRVMIDLVSDLSRLFERDLKPAEAVFTAEHYAGRIYDFGANNDAPSE